MTDVTIMDTKESFGAEAARLYTELFDIAPRARQVDINMRAEVRDRLGDKEFNALKAAEGEQFAQSEKERIKTQVIENDLAMREAIAERVRVIEERLAAKKATFSDRVAAAGASPDALRSAFRMSVDADDEDGILLALQAAREKDLDDLVAHIGDVRPDLGELIAELAMADATEEVEVEDRFELLAEGKVPSKQDILGGPLDDLNVYSQMR